MDSSDNEESDTTNDFSKRKLPASEDLINSTFKKARFSWQVKGGKGKNIPDSSAVHSDQTENRVPEACCSNTAGQYEQPCSNDDENIFHEMDFDASSRNSVQSLRNENALSHSVPISQTSAESITDTMKDIYGTNPETMVNHNRIKHVSTSLHACFLTSRPNSSGLARTSTETTHAVPAISRALSDPVISDNNSTRSLLSNDDRDRMEFRDALSGMHQPNLSAYEKWQKRNTAGAIVDNVFNRTLEEMGVSPDAASNRRALDRSNVENQSILAAISSQGLTTNRNNPSYTSGLSNVERSDLQDRCDSSWQNPDIFDKTFERLGYFRYGIVHQSSSDTPDAATNTEIVQNQTNGEESVAQTDILTSGQSGEETSAAATCYSGERNTVLNVSTENMTATIINSESSHDNPVVCSDMNREIKEIASKNDPDTKEKDTVNENVLNLALSAAIQSQGLTFK